MFVGVKTMLKRNNHIVFIVLFLSFVASWVLSGIIISLNFLFLFISIATLIIISHRYQALYDASTHISNVYTNSIKKARHAISDLIKMASIEIKIVENVMTKEIYNSEEIIKAIEFALDKKVSIDLLYYETDSDAKEMEVFKRFKEIICIKKLKQEPKCSFIVVDDRHVRIEKKGKEPGDATYRYNTSFLALRAERKFTELLELVEEEE